jgi:hypothetical protein
LISQSRGLGDVYKRQPLRRLDVDPYICHPRLSHSTFIG